MRVCVSVCFLSGSEVSSPKEKTAFLGLVPTFRKTSYPESEDSRKHDIVRDSIRRPTLLFKNNFLSDQEGKPKF